jgi:sodium transport system permease protein
MRVIWVILRKELLDIVRNRRRMIMMAIFAFLVMPVIAVAPAAMVMTLTGKQAIADVTVPVQGMEYAPELMAYLKEQGIQVESAKGIEELIRSKQFSVGLIVPSDYAEKIKSGESAQVILVKDSSKQLDLIGARLTIELEKYNQSLLDERLQKNNLSQDFLEPLHVETRNTASEAETAGSMLSLLIPGFLIGFAMSAGMPVAVAAVAGEKSKLTLEPVLFTTVNRSKLVFAKLLAVLVNIVLTLSANILALGFTLLVFVLVMLSVMSTRLSAAPASGPISMPFPMPMDYTLTPVMLIFLLLLLLLSPVPILILSASLQLMVSTWARNEEEAFTLLAPMSALSLFVVFAGFFMDEFIPSLWHYSIPIFGTILSMRDLLSGHLYAGSLFVMFTSSLVYAALILALAVWLFQREEVVFRT